MKTTCGNMATIDTARAIIQPLSQLSSGGATIDMLRLDLIHPLISGNKWFKLRLNLEHARKQGYRTILTFGGAHSNHLLATAAACAAYGMEAIGIVRGLHGAAKETATLERCRQLHMHLHFVSRGVYRQKDDPAWLHALSQQYPDAWFVPEGGANQQGRTGAEEIASLIPAHYTHICGAVGSGTTLIGLRNKLPVRQKLFGFVPMKGGRYLEPLIRAHLISEQDHHWQLYDTWHFGGFGKTNKELDVFMEIFLQQEYIRLDPVYTGKMMFGVRAMQQQKLWPREAKVICIHSGGLRE